MQVLNEEQAEAEAILQEEIGEVLQALGKLKRFGFTPVDCLEGGRQYDNLEDLCKEQADLLAAMVLMQYVGLLYQDEEKLAYEVRRKCMKMALRFQSISGRDFMAFVAANLKEKEDEGT